jgi:hypothetical protein
MHEFGGEMADIFSAGVANAPVRLRHAQSLTGRQHPVHSPYPLPTIIGIMNLYNQAGDSK